MRLGNRNNHMLKNCTREMLAAVLLILTFGCHTVYVTEPLGREAVEIKPSEWEGTWRIIGENHQIQIAVEDAKSGLLRLREVGDKASTDTMHIFLRPAGDQEWLVTAENDDPKKTETDKFAFAGLLR